MQAHIAQLQQQMAHLTEIAKQQQMVIDKDQIKSQTELQKAQIDAQTKLQIKQMELGANSDNAAKDREVKLAVAELGAKTEREGLFMEERARVGAQSHEVGMAAATAAHDGILAAHDAETQQQAAYQQHAQQMAQQQDATAGQAALADQSHGHALEQGQQAAALAPEPQPAGV